MTNDPHFRRGIDWAAAHASLDRFTRLAESGSLRSREEVDRLLAARAERFARPRPELDPSLEEVLDLLVFGVGSERYAVETRYVLEVMALRGLTPLPATPPFIVGIVQRRGHVLPVVDLPRLLGSARPPVDEARGLVALHARDMTIGVLAHEIGGIRPAPVAAIGAPPGGDSQRTFIRGVVAEDIAVVDVEGLARDPRLVVNEESE